jgi:two-component system, cell cycle response regulator
MKKILIADIDAANNIPLKKLLFRWGFDVVTASDGAEAWRILKGENPPQMAILDWDMPNMDGLEICRRLREKERGGNQYAYVIMMTSRGEKQDIVVGMDAGADDYIVKPFDKEELRVRLYAGQRIIDTQTSLMVANKRLLIMSRLDPLTGALSRNAIIDDLDLAMYRTARENIKLSVVLVDLDGLKQINEQYGRQVGDQILQDSVRRINASLRRTDNFGRYGGDEFLVILTGIDKDRSLAVCKRIKKAIGEKIFVVDGLSLTVTASQSLAFWDGKAGMDDLLASVERLLSEAKGNGANQMGPVA